MYSTVKKPKAVKRRTSFNYADQQNDNIRQYLGFFDNRPQVIEQRKTEEMVNNSPHALAQKRLKDIVGNAPPKQLQVQEDDRIHPSNAGPKLFGIISKLTALSREAERLGGPEGAAKTATLRTRVAALEKIANGSDETLKTDTLIRLQNELASSPVPVGRPGEDPVQKQSVLESVQKADKKVVLGIVAGLATAVTLVCLYVTRQKKVEKAYIEGILKDVKNEPLRGQLLEAWQLLEKNGDAYYESDAGKHQGGYDEKISKFVLRIPEQGYFESADSALDKKAIAVHELTHVAEVIANTRGKTKMVPGKDPIMESDIKADHRVIERLFGVLEKDKAVLEAIPFDSANTRANQKTMYHFIHDRFKYAGMYLSNDQNFELPTVVNQIVYVMDAKGGTVVETATYRELLGLQQALTESRAKRR